MILLGILLGTLSCLMIYAKYALTYWERRGVRSLSPRIPFGSLSGIFLRKKNFGETFKEIYDVMKSKGESYAGAYSFLRPLFVPISHEYIKNVMQTDFAYFSERGFYVNEETDPLTGNLFSLGLHKWRILRAKLTPTFTTGKMKMMFTILANCAENMTTIIDRTIQNGEVLDTKEVLSRFTTDVIGSCAFGIECNSLEKPDTEFRRYGDKIFEPRLAGLVELAFDHDFLRKLRFKSTPSDIERFFRNIVEETVEYREKNEIRKKDFMDLLIQLKNKGFVTDDGKTVGETNEVTTEKLTMNELIAQCYVFFAAGYETSSTTATFALFELAFNQSIQDKAREEVLGTLEEYDDKITYEAIIEMTFLDKIVYETLRKYPPLAIFNRLCTKDYNLPGTSLVIKKKTPVFIPVLGIHYDPEYYPEPETFDPERFNEEQKKSRPAYTWIPFGDGPRICIGLRFGMMTVKVILATILKNYRTKLNDRTTVPLQFEPTAFVSTAKGGVWLNMKRIERD